MTTNTGPMKYISFLIVILPVMATGQTVTVSPASIPLWGAVTGYSHVGIEYKDIGVHYFHSNPGEIEIPWVRARAEPNIGVSYVPIEAGILNLGAIAFPKQFPQESATKINMWIELNIPVHRFYVRYIHISNAYQSETNPGVDMLSLSYSF